MTHSLTKSPECSEFCSPWSSSSAAHSQMAAPAVKMASLAAQDSPWSVSDKRNPWELKGGGHSSFLQLVKDSALN